MERVVNFLNAHQHKVLFLFHEKDTNRVRYMMVISRRKSNVFMMEIGHGGIVLPPPDTPEQENIAWSVMSAEAYRYPIQPNTLPLPMELEAPTRALDWVRTRMPSWGWDGNHPASIVLFHHPYMILADPGGASTTSFRLDDFEWSLDDNGLFVCIRLEDFHNLKHTVHERIERIIENKIDHIVSVVSDFLKTTVQGGGEWKMPRQERFIMTMNEDMKSLASIRESMKKTRDQLCSLYKILHDVSLETLNVEDRMASVDHMVFHQMLSFGQQKRKLHRSMDQLRLLEKHVLEFLMSLHFQYDDRYLSILSTLLGLQTQHVTCENIIQTFLAKTHAKNDSFESLQRR